MRGPAPLPTALKIARGNPGKRALPKGEPSHPAAGVPDPPATLDTEGAGFWRAVCPLLSAAGCFSVADVQALEVACHTWSQWRRLAAKEVSGEADLHDIAALHSARMTLLKFFQEFGLTPASRSRVRGIEARSCDPLEAFLKQG